MLNLARNIANWSKRSLRRRTRSRHRRREPDALLSAAPTVEMLEDRTLLSVTIDNGLATNDPDYFAVELEAGGAALNIFQQATDTVFEYFPYFDDGTQVFNLLNHLNEPTLDSPGQATSTGTVDLGANGSVFVTVTSSITPGSSQFSNRYDFIGLEGYDLTNAMFYQYLDADIQTTDDDLMTITGTIPGDDLVIATIDPLTGIVQTQRSIATTGAALSGFSADKWFDLQDAIEAGGHNPNINGQIDTNDLISQDHEVYGPSFGPADITSSLAYQFTSVGNASITTALDVVVKPDLAGEFTSTFQAPITGGENGDITVSITNFGAIGVNDTIEVNIYASPESNLDVGSDDLLSSDLVAIDLLPTETAEYIVNVTMPGVIASSAIFLIIDIDSLDDVDESIETNNTVVRRLSTQFLNGGLSNALVVDSIGVLHLAFHDTTDGALKYITSSADGVFSTVSVVDNTSPEVGIYVSAALDSNGLPAVAYYDAFNGDLRYAGFDGMDWTIEVVQSIRTVGLYPSLQFAPDDTPVITYYHKTNGNLIFAELNGAVWDLSVIDSTNDVGRYSSLQYLSDVGRWAVAYEDTTTGDFLYAQQDAMNDWVISTVDQTNGGGGFVSLAVTDAGNPAMSYYDAFNADLKFAERDDQGMWVTQTVASKRSQGLYTNLYFDDQNRANIVYYHKTNDSLWQATDNGQGGSWQFNLLATGGGRWAEIVELPEGGRGYTTYETATDGVRFNTF